MVKGQDTGSGVNKVETTAGVWQQPGFTCSAADNFQHTHAWLAPVYKQIRTTKSQLTQCTKYNCH